MAISTGVDKTLSYLQGTRERTVPFGGLCHQSLFLSHFLEACSCQVPFSDSSYSKWELEFPRQGFTWDAYLFLYVIFVFCVFFSFIVIFSAFLFFFFSALYN